MHRIIRIAAALALTLGVATTAAVTSPALAAGASISGEVKKIDEGAGKITLKHGPAKSLGMEDPMTMVYRVKAPRFQAIEHSRRPTPAPPHPVRTINPQTRR